MTLKYMLSIELYTLAFFFFSSNASMTAELELSQWNLPLQLSVLMSKAAVPSNKIYFSVNNYALNS